jgi:hypothetical protein
MAAAHTSTITSKPLENTELLGGGVTAVRERQLGRPQEFVNIVIGWLQLVDLYRLRGACAPHVSITVGVVPPSTLSTSWSVFCAPFLANSQ